MANGSLGLLAGLVFAVPGCAATPPDAVTSPEAACSLATARVTGARQLSPGHVAMCDHIREGGTPDGYYVLGLRAFCHEEVCGSTLMGWFAVEKATGAVLKWDVAESRIGAEVAGE